MNWRRGLLRLWLLFTLSWLAALGGVAAYQWRAYPDGWVDVSALADAKCFVGGSWVKCDPSEPNAVREPTAAEIDSCMNSSAGDWCHDYIAVHQPFHSDGPYGFASVRIYAALSAGVPIGLLLIGSGLFWAVRGFQKAR